MVPTFERYTDRARRTVVLSQEESRLANSTFIGSEHLLLALIHEGEGVAATVLRSLIAETPTIDALLATGRAYLEELNGPSDAAPSGHVPYTPRCRLIFELALREALGLGHNYIGTEHLLLGLVREGEGVGAKILTACFGLDLDAIRTAVLETLKGYAAQEIATKPGFERDLTEALMADGCVDGIRVATLRAIVAVAGKVHDAQ